MPYQPLPPEDAAANCIRSHLGTLKRHLLTSMRMHGSPKESTRRLAGSLSTAVNIIAKENEKSDEVRRWRAKFDEFVEQHELI